MKGSPVPAPTLLRPVLDTYLDSAVAVVGCRSRGLERYSCEHDVLVVTPERRPRTSLKIGDNYVDIIFVTERDVLKPTNPEHALSLAFARPVRDTSLVLSTSSATNLATLGESAIKGSEKRLASALKILGRGDLALARGSLVEADFWLLASSYEFAYALLLSTEAVPSPSHLLSQLRGEPKQREGGFEGVTIGAGLEAASRAGCGARLEGVTVLHDILRERTKSESQDPTWPLARTEVLVAKAEELVARVELAECFSFLGQELVDAMMHLMKLNPRKTLTSLTSGTDRLLGERLTRQLGLARSDKAVATGLAVLRDRVSRFARAP